MNRLITHDINSPVEVVWVRRNVELTELVRLLRLRIQCAQSIE